jgi:16S rRNA (guanine527-N7)-methyltransferase
MMNETEKLMLPEMNDIWQQTLNWQPTAEQKQLFQNLYEGIIAGNQQLNLTRITEPREFWEKHLWDSLRGIGYLGLGEIRGNHPIALQEIEDKPETLSPRVIDIGTGAGFPGLPIAIACPQYSITLLDSTRKKITFLDTLITQQGIQNVTTLIGRAEAINQQLEFRQNYDIALLRAVAPASSCAEYALPFLKTRGLAVLYRGHWTDEETKKLTPIVDKLGGKIESIEKFTTPLTNSIRHCIYIRSCSSIPDIKKKKGKRK